MKSGLLLGCLVVILSGYSNGQQQDMRGGINAGPRNQRRTPKLIGFLVPQADGTTKFQLLKDQAVRGNSGQAAGNSPQRPHDVVGNGRQQPIPNIEGTIRGMGRSFRHRPTLIVIHPSLRNGGNNRNSRQRGSFAQNNIRMNPSTLSSIQDVSKNQNNRPTLDRPIFTKHIPQLHRIASGQTLERPKTPKHVTPDNRAILDASSRSTGKSIVSTSDLLKTVDSSNTDQIPSANHLNIHGVDAVSDGAQDKSSEQQSETAPLFAAVPKKLKEIGLKNSSSHVDTQVSEAQSTIVQVSNPAISQPAFIEPNAKIALPRQLPQAPKLDAPNAITSNPTELSKYPTSTESMPTSLVTILKIESKIQDQPIVLEQSVSMTKQTLSVTGEPVLVPVQAVSLTEQPLLETKEPIAAAENSVLVPEKPAHVTEKTILATEPAFIQPVVELDHPSTIGEQTIVITDKPAVFTEEHTLLVKQPAVLVEKKQVGTSAASVLETPQQSTDTPVILNVNPVSTLKKNIQVDLEVVPENMITVAQTTGEFVPSKIGTTIKVTSTVNVKKETTSKGADANSVVSDIASLSTPSIPTESPKSLLETVTPVSNSSSDIRLSTIDQGQLTEQQAVIGRPMNMNMQTGAQENIEGQKVAKTSNSSTETVAKQSISQSIPAQPVMQQNTLQKARFQLQPLTQAAQFVGQRFIQQPLIQTSQLQTGLLQTLNGEIVGIQQQQPLLALTPVQQPDAGQSGATATRQLVIGPNGQVFVLVPQFTQPIVPANVVQDVQNASQSNTSTVETQSNVTTAQPLPDTTPASNANVTESTTVLSGNASMATTAPPTGPTTVPATSQVQVTVAGTANQTSSFPATVPNTSLDSAAVNTVTSGMAGTTAKSVDSVASIGSLSLSQLRSVLSSLLQEFIGSSVNNKAQTVQPTPAPDAAPPTVKSGSLNTTATVDVNMTVTDGFTTPIANVTEALNVTSAAATTPTAAATTPTTPATTPSTSVATTAVTTINPDLEPGEGPPTTTMDPEAAEAAAEAAEAAAA